MSLIQDRDNKRKDELNKDHNRGNPSPASSSSSSSSSCSFLLTSPSLSSPSTALSGVTPIDNILSPLIPRTIPISITAGKQEFSTINVEHGTVLMNAYTNFGDIMNASFPTLFPLGCNLDKLFRDDFVKYLLQHSSNRFSSNVDFNFYMFNLRSRVLVNRGVYARLLNKCSALEEFRKLLEEDDLMAKLDEAIKYPKSTVAGDLLKKVGPLMILSGGRVPYGNTGSSEKALTEMIALHRFYGCWGWFFTVNPVMHDMVLPLRMGKVIENNWEDPTGILFVPPSDSEERRKMMEVNVIGATTGYIRCHCAIMERLLCAPDVRKPSQDILLSTALPPNLGVEGKFRKRGVLGPVSSIYTAHEVSNAGNQHSHSEVSSPFNWQNYNTLAEFNDMNVCIGKYMDSIVAAQLPYNGSRGWPISKQPWVAPQMTDEILSTLESDFSERFAYIASFKQNHERHNFSCWKNIPKNAKDKINSTANSNKNESNNSSSKTKDNEKQKHYYCRFKATWKCFDQITGLYELTLVKHKETNSKSKLSKKKKPNKRKLSAPPEDEVVDKSAVAEEMDSTLPSIPSQPFVKIQLGITPKIFISEEELQKSFGYDVSDDRVLTFIFHKSSSD